jgi:hypothetical protein
MMIAWASEEPADSFQTQIQRFLVIHAENDVSFLNASSGRRRVRENMKNRYCLQISAAGSQEQSTRIR